MEKHALFFDSSLPAAFQIFPSLLHAPRFFTDVSASADAFGFRAAHASADFGCFDLIRPMLRLRRGRLKPSDFFLQPLVFRRFKLIPKRSVPVPGGKISALYFNICFVDGKRMIRRRIQQRSVMGYKDKALLPCKVRGQQRAPFSSR